MKSFILVIVVSVLAILPAISAHFSVTDWRLIQTNLRNAKKDLVEQILQENNQQVQIEQLIARVRQAEDLLNRLGKLDEVDDLPGFRKEAEAFLKELEINLPSFEIIKDLESGEIFKRSENSPYEAIEKDIVIADEKVGEINGDTVKPELAVRRTVEHYQKVRSEVLEKRSQLKQELEDAMQRLNAATTTAEVDKLSAIINALHVQIAASNADVEFARSEVQVRYYQNKVEEDIRQEVKVQRKRQEYKHGLQKFLEAYPLPNRPILFNAK